MPHREAVDWVVRMLSPVHTPTATPTRGQAATAYLLRAKWLQAPELSIVEGEVDGENLE